MKFSKVREGEWHYYNNPFNFWIFEGKEYFTVVCHFGDETKIEKLSSLEIAELWCSEFGLRKSLVQLQSIAPEGGRVEIIDHIYKFVCNGTIADMGYHCCLDIGHKGRCYTNNKKVFFDKEEQDGKTQST